MCDHCGCTLVDDHHHDHDHTHDHTHDHHHGQPETDSRVLAVRQSLLSRNDRLAERNRGVFMAHGITAVNIMSSPGSGKTALLERTLTDGADRYRMGVLVGDLATENDARRMRAKGVKAIQITTGTACHLDAHMVHHALEQLDLNAMELVFIENVGNLVCPASFDLGEALRVVVMAVTEGEDKPLKYPVIFHDASLVLINKLDLADAVEFRREEALANIRHVAPRAEVFEVSARTGQGMEAWYQWLEGRMARKKSAVS